MKDGLAYLQARSEERKKSYMEVERDWPPSEYTQKVWTAHDLECAVVRGEFALCGYVRVPADHPDANKWYDDLDGLEVHGGLTFRCKARGGGAWFGFDTGHAFDWTRIGDSEHPGRIWTVDDVAAETERLAGQFATRHHHSAER